MGSQKKLENVRLTRLGGRTLWLGRLGGPESLGPILYERDRQTEKDRQREADRKKERERHTERGEK